MLIPDIASLDAIGWRLREHACNVGVGRPVRAAMGGVFGVQERGDLGGEVVFAYAAGDGDTGGSGSSGRVSGCG